MKIFYNLIIEICTSQWVALNNFVVKFRRNMIQIYFFFLKIWSICKLILNFWNLLKMIQIFQQYLIINLTNAMKLLIKEDLFALI